MTDTDADNYRPEPADTSAVQLDADQLRLAEELARNIHELWAQRRMGEGWVPGPSRDDLQRTHPGLVPFEELEDSEKEYDRIIAAETLKLLCRPGVLGSKAAVGGSVEDGAGIDAGRATRHVASGAARVRPTLDVPELEQRAAKIQGQVEAAFRGVDNLALALHRRYRFVALAAATAGTLAVMLAILQLFVPEEHLTVHNWLFAIEAVAASFALVTVLYGIRRSIHHRWILSRHRAERLRAVQAEALIDLVRDPLTEGGLVARIERITRIDFDDLKSWLNRDLVPRPPDGSFPGQFDTHTLTRFRELYVDLRLSDQVLFMRRAGSRHGRVDHATRHFLPLLFFASVVCVGVHSVFHLLRGELPAQAAHFFLMLAACIPVVATGLRTYREASQVSRNAARFSSKASALELLRQEMANAGSMEQTLMIAWHAEQVLEAEHREWLRLMLDAEWFA